MTRPINKTQMENDETVMRERVGFTLTSCQFKEIIHHFLTRVGSVTIDLFLTHRKQILSILTV